MPKKKTKLSREQWLAKALVVLAKTGGHLNIDDLVRALGVTKGSFYWHFKNREEFVNDVIDYWFHEYTEIARAATENSGGTPQERLWALMLLIHEHDLTRYDVAFRSWVTREPKLARKLKKVDRFRLNYVRSLFAEIGFKGQELDMRTRLFVSYQSTNQLLFDKPSKKQELALLKKQHAFLIK